jgi:hypothetical protein
MISLDAIAKFPPLMATNLQEVLTQATSLDTVKRREAMNLLEQWETEPMYHAALQVPFLNQDIYLDTSNSYKIRSLAIISLKNGIQKYWRRTAKQYGMIYQCHSTRRTKFDQATIASVSWRAESSSS